MPQTNYGSISRSTAMYTVAEALSHAEPVLILQLFGLSKPMPKNKGEKIHFRTPVPFPVVTTPLVEGVTPTAKQMQYTRTEGTLKQYGDVVEITDVVEDVAEDPVLKDAAMMLGEQAAETMELLTWGTLVGGTNVFYDKKTHTSRAQVDSPISKNVQEAVIRMLKKQRGKKFTQILSGTQSVGTRPIEAAYIGITHTDVEHDIRALPNFTSVAAYGSQKPVCAEEIGSVGEVRYVTSPVLNPLVGAGAAKGATGMRAENDSQLDVYPILYLSKEAFGLVPLSGKDSLHPTIINPDKVDKSDPLGQRGYAGWKSWHLCMILNQFWMARVEVAVTDL